MSASQFPSSNQQALSQGLCKYVSHQLKSPTSSITELPSPRRKPRASSWQPGERTCFKKAQESTKQRPQGFRCCGLQNSTQTRKKNKARRERRTAVTKEEPSVGPKEVRAKARSHNQKCKDSIPLCKWPRGYCGAGKCRSQHIGPQSIPFSVPLCKFWRNRQCTKGDKCKSAHPNLSFRQRW